MIKKPKVSLSNYWDLLMYYYRVKKMPFGEAAKLAQKDLKITRNELKKQQKKKLE